MLLNSILDAIGKTPIVKLHNIGQELPCELYVKCEFLNPGGSIKDRIALSMIEDAERRGILKKGDTLIEATSGNTGIALAMAASTKGYKVIITMPEKNSMEKKLVLEALGAQVYITPNTHWENPESYVSLAIKLQKQIPRAHILDQYANPMNNSSHYLNTAQEIIDDLGPKLSMAVMTMGTGGTIMGVSKKLKEYNSNIKIIGVDPHGSLMSGQQEKHSYLVEGVGSDFVPAIYNNNCADEIIHTQDKESFQMARRLIREEGLLVGGSSGSAVYAMLIAAKHLTKGQAALAILPDSLRNYLYKFVDLEWMKQHNFI